MSLLDHNDEEKEVSTGSVIGKVLIIAAVLFIIAFIVFMVIKNNDKNSAQAVSSAVATINYLISQV